MESQDQLEVKPKIETSIKAQEEYHDFGRVMTVRCERCGDLLKIEPLGESALRMSCACGLYNDQLRGI